MNRNMTALLLLLSIIVSVPSYQTAFADAQEKLDFAAGLEEALGHFWALELNLDRGDAALAETHALHPPSELYDSMKPQLQAADPAFDEEFGDALNDLKNRATTVVPRAQAQAAIDNVKALVEEARTLVVGDALSNDPYFKIQLIKSLLETSIVEYGVAIADGEIVEMAEFQDGQAFVVRSQAIFNEISSEIDADVAADISAIYSSLHVAYAERADPAVIDSQTSGLIDSLDGAAEGLAEDRLGFGAGLEEALGHFWALGLNLDKGNAALAETHAFHPPSELYDSMKPQLQAADPAFDREFGDALNDLSNRATTDVPRDQAQAAIDDVEALVEEARILVVGELLSEDRDFKLELIKSLLETSIVEYGVAITDGEIVEIAEFQDGTAFVWRSQQIFNEISSEISDGDASSIYDAYTDLWAAYATMAEPSRVAEITNEIIDRIDIITGGITQEKLDFAAGLEEALGHFWALELNLNDGNAALAETHALHPPSELYDSMKPQLQAADPAFDEEFGEALNDLKNRATTVVSRAQAQAAIDDVKALVEEARTLVVGDTLSADPNFRLLLMKSLLDTSIVEYGVAISNGQIVEMAEFQDGQAFVVRSQAIFNEISSEIDEEDAAEIDGHYTALNAAYDEIADPSTVTEHATGIITVINSITGDDADAGIQDHIDAIRMLLAETRTAYSQGDITTAKKASIDAYLDHFEFLELPLINAGEREFMVDLENEMRVGLRTLIDDGAAVSTVSGIIDRVLAQIDRVEDILTGSSGN